eukprot:g17005.t1
MLCPGRGRSKPAVSLNLHVLDLGATPTLEKQKRGASGRDQLPPTRRAFPDPKVVCRRRGRSKLAVRLTSELRKYLDRFMFDTVKIPLEPDLISEEGIAGGSGERDPAGRCVERKRPRHQRERPEMDEICGEPPLTERQLRSRHATVGMRPRVKVLYSHVSSRSTAPKARPVDPVGPPHTDQLGAAEQARVRAEWEAFSHAVRSMPMEWLALPFFDPLSASDVPEQEPDEYPTRTRLNKNIFRVLRALEQTGRHLPLLYSVYQSPWNPREGAVGKVEVKRFLWHPDAEEYFYETFPRRLTSELREYLDRFMFDTVKIPLPLDLISEEGIAGGSGERDPAGCCVEHKRPRHQRERPLGAAERARVRAEWEAFSDAVRSMPMEWLALPFFDTLSAPDVPEQEPDEYPTRTRLNKNIFRVLRALGQTGRHLPLLYSVYQSPWNPPEGAVGKVEVKQFLWNPDGGENFYETFPRFVTSAEAKWRWAMESYASRVRAATISGGEQAFAGSQRTQELEAPDGFISSMPELHSHLQPNDLAVLYFQPEVQEHSLLVSRAEPRGSQLAGDGFFMRDHVAAFERLLQRAVEEVKRGEIFRRRKETQAVVQGLARASPRPVMLSDFNVRVVYVGRGQLSRAFFRRYCEERGWLAAREDLFATRRLRQWWRADLQYYFVVPLVLVDEHLTAQMTRTDLFSLFDMASELDKAFLMAADEEQSNENKKERFRRYSPEGVPETAHGG